MKLNLLIWIATILIIPVALLAQGGINVSLEDSTVMLTYSCDGSGAPLPDGTWVLIYQDANNNGPDPTDRQPPVCPDSTGLNCPSGTVNYNRLPINGVHDIGRGGTFIPLQTLVSWGGQALPGANKFYCVVPIPNSSNEWVSEVSSEIPETYSEYDFNRWACNPISASELPPQIVTAYALSQNYPNPFNSATEISFALPQTAQTLLRVIDLQGRTVTTLANSLLNAGEHRVIFNGESYSSGIYFVRMESGEFSSVKKMVLLK